MKSSPGIRNGHGPVTIAYHFVITVIPMVDNLPFGIATTRRERREKTAAAETQQFLFGVHSQRAKRTLKHREY
jgi:hypothetical protein